jgi:RHS repeat-associated protein
VKKSSGKLYWGALTESDLSGNVTADFVFFGSQRVARVDMPSGTVHYFFTDRLTSIGVVTNATGTTIEQEIDHRPFGEESMIVNTITGQDFRFMGKEHDPETSYDFFGARFYNSMSGRWLSPDWTNSPSPVPYATLLNPQTLNLYAFVQNNPATNIELDGHIFQYVRHLEAHYIDSADDPANGLADGSIAADVGVPDTAQNDSQQQGQMSSAARFKTPDQAAAAALAEAAKMSDVGTYEYGGTIYRNADGTYSYTAPVTQHDTEHVNPGPMQKNTIGDYHTHPTGNPSSNKIELPDKLSAITNAGDVRNLNGQKREKKGESDFNSYIGTPNGKMIRFRPDTRSPDGLGVVKEFTVSQLKKLLEVK